MDYTPCFDHASIKLLTELLYLEHESCGFLNLKNNKLEAYVDQLAIYGSDGSKKYCQHSHYQTYTWHTHCMTDKAYPSAEDIRKTLKTQSIRTQLIFTKWGIWELSAGVKRKPSDPTFKRIQEEGFNLYRNTDTGRENLTSKTLQHIKRYIKSLTYNLRTYELEIYFTPWDQLQPEKPYYCLRKF